MAYALLQVILINQVVVDALNNLKQKTCKDFQQLLCKVQKGYNPDYEFILEEISFIDLIDNKEISDKLSLNTLQYYLNNEWT